MLREAFLLALRAASAATVLGFVLAVASERRRWARGEGFVGMMRGGLLRSIKLIGCDGFGHGEVEEDDAENDEHAEGGLLPVPYL